MLQVSHQTRLEIHGKSDAIADITGAKQRQHQIGSGARAPAPQGLSEVLVMLGKIEIGGDIQQTQKSDRAIEREASNILYAFGRLALQEIVDPDPKVFKI